MNESTVASDKARLRAEMRLVRRSISDRARRSAQMWGHLEPILESALANRSKVDLFAHADGERRVMAFLGAGTEPETDPWIAALSDAGVDVCLPRCEGPSMVAVALTPETEFVVGSFGIREPLGPTVDAHSIDAVVVPGLAFTSEGARLGQGGGYYDRFLPMLRPDCVTIGVCFAPQLLAFVPTQPHDLRVMVVVTELGVS